MGLGEFFGWYFRSTPGIVSAAAGAVCAIALAGAGISPTLALPAGVALAAVSSGIALAMGAGQKAAAAARDAAIVRKNREKLAGMAGLRDRIARLRISDPEVSDAVGLVVLASGECIDACRRESSYDPAAAEALAETLDVIDLYLNECDEASTEKRYSLDDKDPFADARGRALAALRGNAETIRERRLQVDGGLSSENRMTIHEDLKGEPK